MLPPSWESVTLGEFVENEKGKKPKKQAIEKNAECNLPYIDIEAFEEGKIKSWTNGEGCRICYESDFLMVWDGSRSGLVGKGMYGALGSTLVRINFPNMNNQYAYYFLLSKYQEINTRAKGSGTPHVDPALLWNYQFPIAPFNEQKRIVAKIEELFSELDNGIAALKTARKQLKVYRQSVLKHAFEGKLTAKWREDNADKLESPEQLLARIQQEREARYQEQLEDWETAVKEWKIKGKEGKKPSKPRKNLYDIELDEDDRQSLPWLPNSWMWLPLNELISGIPRAMQSGPFGSNLKHSEFTTSGILVIGIDNVKDGYFTSGSGNRISEEKFAELEKYEARPGDLLVTVMASLGRTCVVPRDIECAIITKHVYRISMEQHLLCPEFYNYLLQSHTVSRLRMFENAQGQTRPGLNSTILKELPVPLCHIDEQKLIVAYIEEKLNSIANLETDIVNVLKRSETLRQSILKKAFSGQLVPQDPSDEPASKLLARIQAEKEFVNTQKTSKSNKRHSVSSH